LDSLTKEQWLQVSSTNASTVASDPMTDTALRRFRQGTVLSYGFEIYGAKLGAANKPELQKRIRIYNDGKLIMDGQPTAVDLVGQNDLTRIKIGGAMAVGKQLPPGDYVMQVIVTDLLTSAKNQTVSQYVEFEIVE
jgi:hypothetical protein